MFHAEVKLAGYTRDIIISCLSKMFPNTFMVIIIFKLSGLH